MPSGLELTVPLPAPLDTTMTRTFDGGGGGGGGAVDWNAAVTLALASSRSEQPAAPLHAPLQPAKVKPDAGVATSAICVPVGKVAWQVAPQSIPAGADLTVPEPLTETESTAPPAGGTPPSVVCLAVSPQATARAMDAQPSRLMGIPPARSSPGY